MHPLFAHCWTFWDFFAFFLAPQCPETPVNGHSDRKASLVLAKGCFRHIFHLGVCMEAMALRRPSKYHHKFFLQGLGRGKTWPISRSTLQQKHPLPRIETWTVWPPPYDPVTLWPQRKVYVPHFPGKKCNQVTHLNFFGGIWGSQKKWGPTLPHS